MLCLALCCCSPGGDVRRQYDISKWLYCVCFTLTAIITWLLRDFADEWFLENSWAFGYCSDSAFSGLCSSMEIALRVSFANTAFFGTHAVLLLCCTREEDPRVHVHTSLWALRLLIWAGTIVGFFFVPASAVTIFAQIARAGAAVFLVFIMVELVTWVYELSGWLVDADTRAAWAALVGGAALSICGGLALIGLGYYFYAPSPSCGLNIFFCTWSLITGAALVGVLFIPGRQPAAGLLTSGAVFLYASYLLLSAMGSEPDGECTRGMGQRWLTIVGFFLAIAAVSYSTLTLGTSTLMGTSVPDGGGGGDAEDPALKVGLPYRADFFHLVYMLASMYLGMLFTGWQLSSSTQDFELASGWASTWVKMGSKWFCEALYVWTVVAPRLLPNRDFS